MGDHKPGDPPWLPMADRLYRAALFVFPNRFRIEYGPWMRQAFLDRCREVRNGERSAFQVLALELVPDLIATFGREQMQAGIGDVFPRQFVLLGLLCIALFALLFRDAITPPVLNQVVTARNWIDGSRELRNVEARESIIRVAAASLSAESYPSSKALAAWLYSAIAVRKDTPYWAPDNQNEATYRHQKEDASVENDAIRQLVEGVLRGSSDAHALARASESCRLEGGCDNLPAVSQLTRMAPDNGYAWALAFEAAAIREDTAAMRRSLAGFAQAKHYDAFEGQTIAALLSTTSAADPANKEWGAIVSELASQRHLLGGFSVDRIARYCSRHAVPQVDLAPDQEVRADCLAAFELMAGSSRLGATISGNMGVATLSEDAATRTAAIQQLRDRYWLAGARFENGNLSMDWPGEFASEADQKLWVLAFRDNAGEVPSLKRLFAAKGMPVGAPANYEVPTARYTFAGSR